MRTYWMFWDNMAVTDRFIPKGRCVIIPETLQRQAVEQHHVNHMGVKKTKLLACKSIYCTGMNNDIENPIRIALHVLIFSKCSQKKKYSPWSPRQTIRNSWSRHVLPTQQKLPLYCRISQEVPKKLKDLSADSLILACKIIYFFQNMVYPTKIISDASGDFISDKLKDSVKTWT